MWIRDRLRGECGSKVFTLEPLERRLALTIEAPENIFAFMLANGYVQALWQDKSSDESGFDLQYSIDEGDHYTTLSSFGPNFQTNVASVPSGGVPALYPYVDRIPDQSKDYRFRVRVFRTTGGTTEEAFSA